MGVRAGIDERGLDRPAAEPSGLILPAARAHGLDRFELAVLLAFSAVAAWVLALDLWQVVIDGRVWTGTDGLFVTDQMQYLAWIQSSSRHVLASDLFVLHPTAADYLQPLLAISGALTALGVAAWLAFLVWQPVAVIAIFFAVRAYARDSLAGQSARRAALVIGLFGGSLPAIGDLWPGFWAWGYPYALISIAAMAAALVSYGRAHVAGRLSFTAAALGALAAWLHPWQGEALILIVIGAEFVLQAGAGPRVVAPRRITQPAVMVIATSLPLLYYQLLARTDPLWGTAQAQSKHSYSLATIVLALAPFLAVSAFAYRSRPRSFIAAATRVWPPAALVVFVVSETGISATPLHAFAAITIPLGVLSVEGWQSAPWQRIPGRRALGPLLLAAATIPTTADELKGAAQYAAPAAGNANFVTRDEQRALDYLAADPQPGGVLTRAYLGLITPADTGRNTYLGACQWSQPDCKQREILVNRIFQTPGIAPQNIRDAVLGTGARFVLNSDCTLRGKNLDLMLAPIASSTRHFGCATVYEIRQQLRATPR